jgi:dTDP-4-dehydrorhamnose 3,5-epimerase
MELIDGVVVKELNQISDERGYVQECLRSDWSEFNKFGQAYITAAFPNVVKAWHMHKIQTDNLVCVFGNAKMVLCDKRVNSPTKNLINEFLFGDTNPILISIPPNIWHGFKAISVEKIIVLNCPTEVYNYSQPDEYRLPHDTDEIDYDWE